MFQAINWSFVDFIFLVAMVCFQILDKNAAKRLETQSRALRTTTDALEFSEKNKRHYQRESDGKDQELHALRNENTTLRGQLELCESKLSLFQSRAED